MDYDSADIASAYDAARRHSPEVLAYWLDLIALHAPPNPGLIVDLGCGTGRFTEPLAERFRARVIGVDPSGKMLDQARRKTASQRVEFVHASAEALPLGSHSVDLIYMSMVYHHLTDPTTTARQCVRILRKGGRMLVRNSTRDSDYPQANFFPGIAPMFEAELPLRDDVVRTCEALGLRLHAYQLVMQPVAANWAEFADRMALRADSFLARLPDADFDAGIAKLRAYARGHDASEPVREPVHFFCFEA
jgi:ubiquinone/menaquinone biosynthesis C-methylase UbiE